MLIGIEAAHANKRNRTGVEEVCWQIIQTWKKIIPSDMRVVLYSNQPLSGELGNLPGNWSAKVLKWPFKKGWSQVRLASEFFFRPPDIFFAPGQLVPLFSPKNTVTVVHDSAFRAFPQAYGLSSRAYLHWMNKLIGKKSKLIITPSEFSKRELIKYYNFAEDKIVVAPWCYDQTRFKQLAPDRQILTKYGLAKPFIMSVGRLERKKNTKRLIQAFNLIRRSCDLQLLLAGVPGVGYEETRLEIINSPYQEDIIRPGWMDADLPQLLNQAKAFVFPSLYEGFGLPVLEAMACGCPVICSRGNSLAEVGGELVRYVDPDNVDELAASLGELLSDEDHRQQQVKYGLARAKEFSWLRTGRAIWEYMKKFLP